MTPARQQLNKHIPEVTLPTKEGRLKARIVTSEYTSISRQRLVSSRLPRNYTHFWHNSYLNNSSGTLEGGEFYPVLPKF
jgi:hypothetical protein